MADTQQQQADRKTQAQLAALLATGAATAVLASQAVALLTPLGITAGAVRAALRLPGITRRVNVVGLGPAGRQVALAEPTYRAAYLLNAARRIQARVAAGMSETDALRAEVPLLKAHLAAQANRAKSAAAVDAQARRHGLVLGWKAVMDARTSAECRAANRKNFSVVSPPLIGWPGAVHPHCRCVSVPAFAGAPMLPSLTPIAATIERKAVG